MIKKEEKIDYFKDDDLARQVWESKYKLGDETLDEFFDRIASEFARLDNTSTASKLSNAKYDDLSVYGQERLDCSDRKEWFLKLFKDFKYIIPGGSVLAGLGSGKPISLSNCFVLDTNDSIDEIFNTSKNMSQIYKRRGGCIEENTPVIIKNKGNIAIKDVKVGDYILSFNIITLKDEWKLVEDKYYTDVNLEDQIELNYVNGVKLKTSKKHPILSLTNKGYDFINEKSGKLLNTTNKSPNLKRFEYEKTDLDKAGWFLGCHFGDGSADFIKNPRIRIVGDNKNVIESYKIAHESILNIKENPITLSKNISYKVDVWEYSSSNPLNNLLFDEYFDNQLNKKTYTWKIPTYVKQNNLWTPFIAGLIDADGYITDSGRIDISICSKYAIDELGQYLSSIGQSYTTSIKIPERSNESPIYNLHIHKDSDIYIEIMSFIQHDLKLVKMLEKSKIHQSNNIQLTDVEIDFITNYKYSTLFSSTSKEYRLLKTNSYNLNKNKACGKAHLSLLKNYGIITEEKYFEILSRTKLFEIIEDNSEKLNYIDISVEENNNYYAGVFGFVNIHNCGVDTSSLRPSGAGVNNAAKTTGGVVPFMELFSQVTNTIGQNGRRGALMLSIDINHPDSPDFIISKQNLSKITGANISVKLNDEFMKAVENDEDYILRWPTNIDKTRFALLDTESLKYNELVETNNTEKSFKCYVKKIRAKELWDSIIQCAWNTAEPGILFWDNILDNDPASVYPEFRAVSTNPCGEIPLSPYDSCRLIATNLYNLVDDKFTDTAELNEDLAYKVFYEAQIIGDILVDLEAEYVQRIIDITEGDEQELWKKVKTIGLNGRRTGVGLTGYADMCAALGVNYGNVDITEVVMDLKMKAELDATIDLAIINGFFPSYNRDLEYDSKSYVANNDFYDFLKSNFPYQWERMFKYGRRNVSFSTIAPTGSISILAGTSSGCEPVFSLYYTRRKKCNNSEKPDFIDNNGVGFTNHSVVHGGFKDWYSTQDSADELKDLTINELDLYYKDSPWYNNTANDIKPEDRIETQSIMQKYTTHSISSTVNLPNTTTKETIDKLYKLAYTKNLKGVTCYVDGSRSGILVKTEEVKPILTERPEELECKVVQFKNEKKDWIAFVGIMNGKPREIFTGPKDLDTFPIPSSVTEGKIIKIKIGDEPSRYDFRYVDSYGYTNTLGGLSRVFDKEYWNYARLLSALLMAGVEPDKMIHIVEGLNFANKSMTNWKSGVMRSFKPFIPDGTVSQGEKCSECGEETIVYEGGCKICKSCGNSHCA